MLAVLDCDVVCRASVLSLSTPGHPQPPALSLVISPPSHLHHLHHLQYLHQPPTSPV